MNITIEFYIFEIVKVPNFSLKWQFWIFLTKLITRKKGISDLKRERWKITFKFCIFESVSVLNFSFNKQFWFLEQICPKIILSKITRNEHHHGILHNRIQFKWTILIFWTKFTQKRYFRPKSEEFCRAKLVLVPN